ncbi:hypothetical protein DQ239_04610 [Blastococcus sp. TF02-09]|uniref:hypothetical protein n=1 Tax=Blastococcus sp. TF02-09 TaxID=2250576 RepID=UPI000DE85BF6|nr:hypothetical protein [Blastococcus sp. TF02-9]RBY80341.1 hypothetical protein DQ239_04610 [Blastococcus sp. TF02-9]
MPTEAGATPPQDAADRALADLVTEIDRCVDELRQARARAETLSRYRRDGEAWVDVVTSEARPLIVERISTVLATLSAAGHRWRREQAAALQAEQISINRIAALFGVTRQRISALLRETDQTEQADGTDRADPAG